MKREDKSSEDPHSCCHSEISEDAGLEKQSSASSRVGSYLGAIGAAIVACACCCLPVVAIALGVATMNQFEWFHKYHLIFQAGGWLIMLGAVLYMWHQHRRSDVHILRDKHFWIPLVCMQIVYLGMTAILEKTMSDRSSSSNNFHNHHER